MDIMGVVTLIGGVGTALVSWMKIGLPLIRKQKAKKDDFYKKINEIHGELKYNGGSSIKDAMKRVEEKVELVSERIDSLEDNNRIQMNLMGVPFWISNNEGEFTYVSTPLCKLLGRSEHELNGNKWMTWISAEDKIRIMDAWKTCIENEMAFDEIFKVRTGDNKIISVWAVAFPKAAKLKTGGILGKMVMYEKQ